MEAAAFEADAGSMFGEGEPVTAAEVGEPLQRRVALLQPSKRLVQPIPNLVMKLFTKLLPVRLSRHKERVLVEVRVVCPLLRFLL